MAAEEHIERKWAIHKSRLAWLVEGPDTDSRIEVMPVSDHLAALGKVEKERYEERPSSTEYAVGRAEAAEKRLAEVEAERDEREKGWKDEFNRRNEAEGKLKELRDRLTKEVGEFERGKGLGGIAFCHVPVAELRALEKACSAALLDQPPEEGEPS